MKETISVTESHLLENGSILVEDRRHFLDINPPSWHRNKKKPSQNEKAKAHDLNARARKERQYHLPLSGREHISLGTSPTEQD